MKKIKIGTVIVCVVSIVLILFSFFAKNFVLYDFQMNASDYSYSETEDTKPKSATTAVWFSYGESGRQLQYGLDSKSQSQNMIVYAMDSENGVYSVNGNDSPIRSDSLGHFIAVLPEVEKDIDQDGTMETIYDYARSDLGPDAFNPTPQRFESTNLPYELVFAERKYVMVYYNNEILKDAPISVTSDDGIVTQYRTDHHGWIKGLPIKDIREGFTASYSPDEDTVYQMFYALEDYSYFSTHFFIAHIPLLLVFFLSAIGIAIVCVIRKKLSKNDPSYLISSREKVGIYHSHLKKKTTSRFLIIRWLCLFAAMFVWTYAGQLINQGQALNEIAVPLFSCPFNLNQIVETPCYYLAHLPALFTRFGAEFPIRNIVYAVTYLGTTFLFFVFLGRILCGFLCPAGLLQDLMDKLRQTLHVKPIVVTDKMNKILQPLKWVWIILFLGMAFTGGDFCDICPLKGFTTAQGGYWANLYLGGFLAIILLIGSFFIKRFWCIMCPMGYLMGIFHKFNLFKLKKSCNSCTECGACYNACPMKIKSIYTERQKEDIQTIDCLMCGECINKCPEDNALAMTFCKKTIYKSSRATFMSRFSSKRGRSKTKRRKK